MKHTANHSEEGFVPIRLKNKTIRVSIAIAVAIVHLIIWFQIWGFTEPPTIATTHRNNATSIAEQYWVMILSGIFPIAVWKRWSMSVLVLIVGLCGVVWLLRLNVFQQYGN
jgi:hypothetical protein